MFKLYQKRCHSLHHQQPLVWRCFLNAVLLRVYGRMPQQMNPNASGDAAFFDPVEHPPHDDGRC